MNSMEFHIVDVATATDAMVKSVTHSHSEFWMQYNTHEIHNLKQTKKVGSLLDECVCVRDFYTASS